MLFFAFNTVHKECTWVFMVCMIAPTMGIFLHFLSCDCVVYYVVLIFWLHCHKVYFLVVFRLGFLCFFFHCRASLCWACEAVNCQNSINSVMKWKHSIWRYLAVYYQPTSSARTVWVSSGLLVGENYLISFNTSQHYTIMCLRIKRTDDHRWSHCGNDASILPFSTNQTTLEQGTVMLLAS